MLRINRFLGMKLVGERRELGSLAGEWGVRRGTLHNNNVQGLSTRGRYVEGDENCHIQQLLYHCVCLVSERKETECVNVKELGEKVMEG